MGGLLFHTERMPAKEFKIYLKHLSSILKRNHIEFQIPRYFADKKDFGDLDLLIHNGVSIQDVELWFKKPWYNFLLKTKVTPLEDWFVNGDVVSVKYKNFQIDFIRTRPENWESAYNYFSWNDLGNLIGRLAHKFGLKYGHEGLVYPYNNDKNQKVGNVKISKNIDEILLFLNLDVKKFHKGFENIEEIFKFIIASKYFNPHIYDLEHLNKINRDRNKKRKTYQLWLEYIEPLKKDYPSTEVWFEKDKKEWIPYIDLCFPDARLIQSIDWFKHLENLKEIRNAKFNGRMVVDAFPNQLKEVGNIIHAFKEYICSNAMKLINKNGYNIESIFTSYLDGASIKEVQENFENFVTIYKTG